MEVKIEVFTLCWNEMAILPFAVDYWARFASHVTVYDNGSDDGSVEFLQKFPDWITVHHFDTEGHKDNTAHMVLKNKMWKEARGRADLVCVCDLDEFLIIRGDAAIRMVKAGGTICEPNWYELVSETVPEYKEGRLLHQLRPCAAMPLRCDRMPHISKAVLFDPNYIDEINYGPGSHCCKPKGRVRWFGGDIYVLHVNNSLSLKYKLNRYRLQAARRSASDRHNGYGKHYTRSDGEILKDWKDSLNRAVDFCAIVE